MDTKKLLELVVKAADSKRAEDILALDVQKVSLLADYFVITHGNNERQIHAIVDNVVEEIGKNGGLVKRIEGRDGGKWILVDLGDVILHVFSKDERDYYNLEKLWSDATLVELTDWISAE
ncbi:ribosome-associated protein [Pilibacter termitis]|uniref:Ribosomal silencing factor RsfS n=1 Tax=Pilibacter termitis TaxID=263852 RepID=A0A1T4KUU7_9ENTE|nr:ribosome silencing factor [Pilibacter termitis]SJZ46191.1 ribosome-associated protein [Pilibacter termitis]